MCFDTQASLLRQTEDLEKLLVPDTEKPVKGEEQRRAVAEAGRNVGLLL